ncbi:hypothetical protein BASA81_007745 [Batrachochytrium salamandrivorans]|nr:hypothetical protein BASA81_007745 [Batrachochytrium salamandrivorans]
MASTTPNSSVTASYPAAFRCRRAFPACTIARLQTNIPFGEWRCNRVRCTLQPFADKMSDGSQAAAAPSRAEVLRNEVSALRAQIANFALEIIDHNERLSDPKEAEWHPQLELALADAKAQQTEAEVQQKLALDELAELEAKPALEELTTKVNEFTEFREKVNESVRDLEEKMNAFVRDLEEKVESLQFGFPLAMLLDLPKMLFAVLDQDAQDGTRTPVGVSFFVRPTLAITAYRVLGVHYPHIEIGDTVYLSREAGLSRIWEKDKDGPNLITTKLVKFDETEDWALMELNEPTEDIIPFKIGSAETARWGERQMLSYNIHLSTYAEAEDVAVPQITRTTVDPRTVMPRMFLYTCAAAHLGDSDGAVVVSATGKAVMMHCDPLNGAKGSDEAVAGGTSSKKHKGDLRAMLSRDGVYVGIRLDYMEKQGHFDGY